MPAAEVREAWSSYWQNEPVERCFVPGDGQAAVDRQWAALASRLPPSAHLLDLGCGPGILGRIMLALRGDVLVTGVDSAEPRWTPQPGLTVRSGVRMESLPFPDQRFDGAVSLFGIEYGEVARTVGELARVLKPGAPFCFIVHHRESQIVNEGGARRRAMQALISDPIKGAFLDGDAAGVRREGMRVRGQYPNDALTRLVPAYYLRKIGCPPAEREELWSKLATDLRSEIVLLEHLERSAKAPAELGGWLAPFLASMVSVGAMAVRRASGQPIAWRVQGVR